MSCKSSKLKPLDAGKVSDTSRVSVEEAKFEKPAPTPVVAAPAPAAAPLTAQSAAPEEHQTVESNQKAIVLSDTAPDATEPASLGDAARKAREKKAVQNSQTAPPQ